MTFCLLKFGGRRGIRTLDTESPYAAFPGRYIQPLCHPSIDAQRDAGRGDDLFGFSKTAEDAKYTQFSAFWQNCLKKMSNRHEETAVWADEAAPSEEKSRRTIRPDRFAFVGAESKDE